MIKSKSMPLSIPTIGHDVDSNPDNRGSEANASRIELLGRWRISYESVAIAREYGQV